MGDSLKRQTEATLPLLPMQYSPLTWYSRICGMMATGTRVVRAGTNNAIGYGRAFGRAAFEYLLSLVLFLPWVLDMLFPIWDPRNQTLHDKVAGTVVINT